MYHNWECTSIYRPLSYPFRSLILLLYRIAFTAHIGGAVAGLFVGIVVLQNRRVQFWEVRNIDLKHFIK